MPNNNTCSCSCNCNTENDDSSCVTNSAKTKVYACVGASNVGVISFELAKALHQANHYQMGCTAGFLTGVFEIENKMQEEGNQDLMIDGCPIACLQKLFEQNGIKGCKHIIVTDFGINKEATLDFDPGLIKQLAEKILLGKIDTNKEF